MRSRVQLRKEERKRASSEIARTEGEAAEATEEGPKQVQRGGEGHAEPSAGLRDAKPKRKAEM